MHKDPEIPKIVNEINDIINYLDSHNFDRDYVNMLHNLKVELVISFNGKQDDRQQKGR